MADLPLRDAAVSDALHLHLDDDPLARRGPRLRHRAHHNGGPGGRTELLWTLVGRIGYDDTRMGYANVIGYVSVLVSIGFTLYFFRKLNAARWHMAQA